VSVSGGCPDTTIMAWPFKPLYNSGCFIDPSLDSTIAKMTATGLEKEVPLFVEVASGPRSLKAASVTEWEKIGWTNLHL
jgi:hypothetical protein